MIKDEICVWFSCGAASAVAAKKTIEKYKNSNVRVVNTPIKEEHEDNRRFLKDVEKWLGVEIEICVNPKYPESSCENVWSDRKFMSSPYGAPCTLELKKNARIEFEKNNKIDWHVLGFTLEEKRRFDKFIKFERSNVLPVLIDAGITKQHCIYILQEAKIKLPGIYKHGFPNANCIGCVKSSSPEYWNLVRRKFPEVFKSRAEQSRQIGTRLVKYKGDRIFLDELDPTATGRIKNFDFECGIFCEEKDAD